LWEEGGDNAGEKGGDQAAWGKQGIGYIGRGREHGEGVGWHAETMKTVTSSVWEDEGVWCLSGIYRGVFFAT
jgi:hypothetical protein